MQELSRQLGNNLPNALEAGARAMNVTTEEFIRMIQTGRVASKEFIVPFARELRKMARYNDALASGTQKLVAQQMRLNTAFKEMIHEIFQDGTADAIGKIFNTLARLIRAITPRVKELATMLSGAFKAVLSLADALGGLAMSTSRAQGEAGALLKTWHAIVSVWYTALGLIYRLSYAMHRANEQREHMAEVSGRPLPGAGDFMASPLLALFQAGSAAFQTGRSGGGSSSSVSIGKIEVNTRSTDPRQTGVEVASQVANFLNMGY
jgi:hypothetical protein